MIFAIFYSSSSSLSPWTGQSHSHGPIVIHLQPAVGGDQWRTVVGQCCRCCYCYVLAVDNIYLAIYLPASHRQPRSNLRFVYNVSAFPVHRSTLSAPPQHLSPHLCTVDLSQQLSIWPKNDMRLTSDHDLQWNGTISFFPDSDSSKAPADLCRSFATFKCKRRNSNSLNLCHGEIRVALALAYPLAAESWLLEQKHVTWPGRD